MIELHERTKQPFPEPQKRPDQQVSIPRSWFEDANGNAVHTLEVIVEGTARVSNYEGVVKHRFGADRYENVEYGYVTYQNIKIVVIAPIAGLHEHWRYYGYPQAFLDRIKENNRREDERIRQYYARHSS